MIYYDTDQSAFVACFKSPWGTAFYMAGTRTEFWAWIVFHVCCISVCKFLNVEYVLSEVNWEVGVGLQYFMLIFVTRYNDECMYRFIRLYGLCTEMTNSVLYFVQEMNITLHHEELSSHRRLAAKYMLAAMLEFHAILTGGRLSDDGWDHLVDKGLLTDEETRMLKNFPGGIATQVLTSWTLFVIQDALRQDCFWNVPQHKRGGLGYAYNRLCEHVESMTRACYGIGHVLAQPVPFVLFHITNILMLINILLVDVAFAFAKNYSTVFPFGIFVLVIYGVRLVSSSLADPFGHDPTDFPVPGFVNHCHDRAVCMLEALALPGIRARVLQRIPHAHEFTHKQLKWRLQEKVLHHGLSVFFYEPPTSWMRKSALARLAGELAPLVRLQTSLADKQTRKSMFLAHVMSAKAASQPSSKANYDDVEDLKQMLEEEKERQQALEIEIGDMRAALALLEDIEQDHYHYGSEDDSDEENAEKFSRKESGAALVSEDSMVSQLGRGQRGDPPVDVMAGRVKVRRVMGY